MNIKPHRIEQRMNEEPVELFTRAHLEQAVKDEREAIKNIDWTALLREGHLVTWGDAATLADRVFSAIRARGQA